MPQGVKKSKYTWLLLLFTAVVAFIIFLLKYVFLVPYVHDMIWYIFLFILFQTLISVWTNHLGTRKSQQALVKYALAATVIRLTLSILVIFIALQIGVDHRLSFVLNFLILYFTFLTFELISLLTTLRANFEKQI